MASEEELLKTRYLDWCSGRITEHLMALEPDQVAVLTERALREAAEGRPVAAGWDGPEPVVPLGASEDATRRMRLLIHALHAELNLPPFDAWAVEYRRDPESFDRDIMGFGPR